MVGGRVRVRHIEPETPIMPDTPSITLTKTMDYRGKAEPWSNKYHFSGTVPSSTAEWKALGEAIFASEKPILRSGTKLTGILGYNAGDNNSVAQIDYNAAPLTPIPGTASGSNPTGPGDVAVWVRWKTPNRNSRGKWIYLRKYFHGMPVSSGAPDEIAPEIKAPLLAHGNKMIDGTLPGGAKICGPQGAVASAPMIAPFTSFRQLKRTGKRPR